MPKHQFVFDLSDPKDDPDLRKESIRRRNQYRYQKMVSLGMPDGSRWVDRPHKFDDYRRRYARAYARSIAIEKYQDGVLVHKNKKFSSREKTDVIESYESTIDENKG